MGQPHFTTGESVIDLYAFGSLLGKGNYGSVRKCMDLYKPGPQMACKTVKAAAANLMDVQREIDAMMAVGEHTNIVQLHGVHRDAVGVHLVQELCEGGELFDEVMRREKFTEVDAADAFWQLASAVEHCHSHGVFHRDIKLENVLLAKRVSPPASSSACPRSALSSDRPRSHRQLVEGAKLHLKLADFGLALLLKDGQKVTEVAGSPFYMPPEVVCGKDYGFSADIWSMGVILFALLSGLLPFTGPSNADIFHAIKAAYIDLDSPAWKSVSDKAKELLRQLLHPDPTARPTAKELLRHPWVCQGVVEEPSFLASPFHNFTKLNGFAFNYSGLCPNPFAPPDPPAMPSQKAHAPLLPRQVPASPRNLSPPSTASGISLTATSFDEDGRPSFQSRRPAGPNTAVRTPRKSSRGFSQTMSPSSTLQPLGSYDSYHGGNNSRTASQHREGFRMSSQVSNGATNGPADGVGDDPHVQRRGSAVLASWESGVRCSGSGRHEATSAERRISMHKTPSGKTPVPPLVERNASLVRPHHYLQAIRIPSARTCDDLVAPL
eukprot:TRINITY_DN23298_c0_g1_i1.p1 TRINITY_DN23298_c0_g1~~TRINITY_DN23298_c0_g1_i1.p1  ORF type:complete len:550 (+),score=45.87 TRINITY_DN23298_c0_g1_i1:283-1932(+)